MRDVINIVNRLVKISDGVIKEFDELADLSYMNRENSSYFLEHVEKIRYYINQECVILNSMSTDFLKEVYNYLIKHDDNSDGYSRAINIVSDKINLVSDNTLEDSEIEEDNEYEEIRESIDNYPEFNIVSEYIKDTENTSLEQDLVIDYFATLAIKNMPTRINNTYTDNSGDNKYKKRLLKHFNRFKYFFFSMDNRLEKIGAFYKFDIAKIPVVPYPNIDILNICNNECVGIINSLYSLNNYEYDLDTISKALFQMLSFEEYITCLDTDTIDRLIELCDKLEIIHQNSFYGKITKNKLLTRKKN